MLDLAHTLTYLRKQHQLTQKDLAQFLDVSTAAISKWETGQSFPDITTLPKLASYFNISIDKLLGYEPQLSKENIQAIYKKLSQDFKTEPFNDVILKIEKLEKQYYSCHPLLVQLSVLLLNYLHLAQDRFSEIALLIEKLTERTHLESQDPKLVQLAISIHAQVATILQQPEKVLQLLGTQVSPYAGNDIILANAYLMLEKQDAAEETFQISLYQGVISNMSVFSNYMQVQEQSLFEESVLRGEEMIRIFDLKNLHFSCCLNFYLSAAQRYSQLDQQDACLRMLTNYVETVINIPKPMELHGDDFFTKIDQWIQRELDLGPSIPSDEDTIRQKMIAGISENPYFEKYREHPTLLALIDSISKEAN